MRVASSIIFSLVLTSTISFTIPVAITGFVFGVAFVVSLIPGLVSFGHQAMSCVFDFLAVFGNDNPIWGLITLGLVSAFVGFILDLSNAYRYQSTR